MEDLLMPRFDVYANEGASAKTTPYVLEFKTIYLTAWTPEWSSH
jgi:hypothetical protein